tara:strand:+ start:73 stop:378 length:306 start_codon:yes stop_codon:yes gene_type:complete
MKRAKESLEQLKALSLELVSFVAQGVAMYADSEPLENRKTRRWIIRLYMYCVMVDPARLILSRNKPGNGEVLGQFKKDLETLGEELEEAEERVEKEEEKDD